MHNGVIENYAGMKKFLVGKGYTFASETDTEALVNLIAYHYQKEPARPDTSRFLESVRKTLRHVEGTYGIAVLCTEHPGEIVAARKGSPLILGVGDARIPPRQRRRPRSSAARRTSSTSRTAKSSTSRRRTSPSPRSTWTDVSPVIDRVTWTIEDAELGRFAHFMEKEIFEQPTALENAMRGRFSEDQSTANFGGLNLTAADFRQIDRFQFCACGTAWHACLVAEHLIERFARVPVEVDYASEFRYRNAPLHPQHALLRHQPVGRNPRHPGRAARGQAQGLQGHGHLQRGRLHHRARGRRRHLPARRPGDRRGLHQGLHLAAPHRRHVRPLRRPHARHELQRRRAVRPGPQAGARPGAQGRSSRRRTSRRSPNATRAIRTSSSSAASRSSPSRSRARSSSRRSPTSTPRATPPPR